jgi:hypothetical protein
MQPYFITNLLAFIERLSKEEEMIFSMRNQQEFDVSIR